MFFFVNLTKNLTKKSLKSFFCKFNKKLNEEIYKEIFYNFNTKLNEFFKIIFILNKKRLKI